jgi:hypothetical protein
VLTSYLCTIGGDGEGNPLTNFLDEEAGGSSRAEFRMEVISEETWMKAAKPTPMLSTTSVPTKFCMIVRRLCSSLL